MNASEYYAKMCNLAREKRKEHGILTRQIKISVIQRLYKAEGVKIDRRNTLPPKIRGMYLCEGNDCSIMLNNKLPKEPKLFTMIHELKHHYVDRDLIENGEVQCGDYDENRVLEVGAEVFAAEFIFPENEVKDLARSLGITRQNCTEESIVRFKHAMPVAVSYKFILKRLVWVGLVSPGSFANTQFQKLEETIYGKPIYKQDWFKRLRAMKKAVL